MAANTHRNHIHIICYGNEWEGDDGFGMHVYKALLENPGFHYARVFEGGVGGFNTLPYFENCRKVIIVDSVKNNAKIGSVMVLTDDELEPGDLFYSLHSQGVAEVLSCIDILFHDTEKPEIVFVGAEIGKNYTPPNQLSNMLSPPLKSAIPKAISSINHLCMS